MASPEPGFPGLIEIPDKAEWLRVMDHHDIRPVVDKVFVDALYMVIKIDSLHLRSELSLHALQQVMEALGAFEVFLVSVNCLPLVLNIEQVEEGDGAIEHLGDTAALRSGV